MTAAYAFAESAEPRLVTSCGSYNTRAEQAKGATRQRRQNRQDAILHLVQQGASIRTIARLLDMSRKTVRRYLLSLPDNARSPQPSICDAYRGYLQKRWGEGVHHGRKLYHEIRAQGYAGSESALRRYLQPWRAALPSAPHSTGSRHTRLKAPQTKEISRRSARAHRCQ